MLIFSATVVVAVNTVVCLHTHTRKFRLLGTRKLHGCFLVVAKNFAGHSPVYRTIRKTMGSFAGCASTTQDNLSAIRLTGVCSSI